LHISEHPIQLLIEPELISKMYYYGSYSTFLKVVSTLLGSFNS